MAEATGRTLYQYVAASDTELNFPAGVVVSIIQPDEGGWTLGRFEDKEGWFPSSYITLLENQAPTPSPASNSSASPSTAGTSTATVDATPSTASDATTQTNTPTTTTSTATTPSASTPTNAAQVQQLKSGSGSRRSLLGITFGSRSGKRGSGIASPTLTGNDANFSILENKQATREILQQKLEERPTPADLVSKNIIDAGVAPESAPLKAFSSPLPVGTLSQTQAPIQPQSQTQSQSQATPAAPTDSSAKSAPAADKKAAGAGNRFTRWFGFASANSSSKKLPEPTVAASAPSLKSGSGMAPGGTILGMPLESLLQGKTRYDVPLLVKTTIAYLEQNGIQEGIFRLSGAVSEVEDLKKRFKSPDEALDLQKICKDPNSVAVLLKQFFGQLPDPLFTFALFDDFVAFAEKIKGHKQIENVPIAELQELLKRLPEGHYSTVQYLMRFLRDLSKHVEKTKMASSNLALVFGPNLLRSKEVTSESLFGMNGSKLVEILILHYDAIFTPS